MFNTELQVKVFDAASTSCGGNRACPLPPSSSGASNSFYLRVSAWSYNTDLGFHYLANVLNRNTCFSQGWCAVQNLAVSEGNSKYTDGAM